MPKKQILILASVASMIDQFNIPLIKLLLDMGYKVHVACNFIEGNTCSVEQVERLKKNLRIIDVDYYQIDFKRNVMKISKNMIAYRQVLQLMKVNNYDFIHCHSPIGGLCGRLAGKKTNTKVIYTAHGFHFYKGASLISWLIYYPIERWLSRYTDVLITINKEDYERAKGFKAKRIEYVPGVGIDVDKINAVEVDRMQKRNELNLPKDAFIILSVGELNKNKNHEVVLRAIAKISNLEIHYVICGQGMLKKYLRNLSRKLGIEKLVHLEGFRRDIIELYKVSDVFMFPSKREGLPVSLMEAMACGLPVICSNIRGNTDLIEEGKGGYLIKSSNIDEFIEAIYIVRNDVKLRRKIGEHNVQRALEYDKANIEKRMRNIYTNI